MSCRLKSPQDLYKLFRKVRKEIIIREESPIKIKILAHSESGFEQARKVAKVFIEYMGKKEVAARVSLGLWNGPLALQPVVEIRMPPLGTVRYGRITEEKAREIVRKHIMKGKTLQEYLISLDATLTFPEAGEANVSDLSKGRL